MGQLTRTTAPALTPARRIQQAERAHWWACDSLRTIARNAAKENAERAEYLTAARLDVATAVRAWGLHAEGTAKAIRHAHAVEDATVWCAADYSRHLANARATVALRAHELAEARAAAPA